MSKVGKAIKIFFVVFIIVFIGTLLLIIGMSEYEALDDLSITPAFNEAYSQSTDVRTHPVDKFSENGGTYAYSFVYIEQSGYLQLTVRYNKNQIRRVISKYPDFKEEDIRYVLIDAKGNEYAPNIIETEEKFNRYKYIQLEFTNVDFSNGDLTINMILDGVDEENGKLLIHSAEGRYIPYEFSSKEKKILNIQE